MERLLLMVAIALLGYVVIPLSGGFRVRRQWRKFRDSLYQSMEYPILTYRIVREQRGQGEAFRFFGHIEASQGEDRLWLSGDSLSVQVDLRGVEVFTLPALTAYEEEGRVEDNERSFADVAPAHVHSRRIAAFPQGTKVMVAGVLEPERSRPVFHSDGETELLVLVYDGDPRTILRRSIWSGRQRNEYWNQLTPVSLTLASFSLFILAYVYLRSPGLLPYAHVALTMSLVPLGPLFPPGVLFFSLYRRIWRTGRYLRAERDLLFLPARRFPPALPMRDGSRAFLPDGTVYGIRAFHGYDEALFGCPEGKIRTSMLVRGSLQTHLFFAFGCETGVNADPFAETVLIPGNPRELSRSCSRGARLREMIAAGIFLAAMIVNMALIFALLWAILI